MTTLAVPTTTSSQHCSPRAITEKYFSVQFSIKGFAGIYQFRIRCFEPESLCILVREDSDVLEQIKEGDVVTMAYCLHEGTGHVDPMPTRIEYICEDERGRFKGHRLIGLSVLAN